MATVVSLPAAELGASSANFAAGFDDGGFLQEVERTVVLLSGQHFLRISLFRFQFVGASAAEIGVGVPQALMSLGMVGLLPDGSLGFLYVAPRPSAQDDLAVERAVAERLNRMLAIAAPSDARLLSVTAAHRWADEIADADDLIDETLFVAATKPRMASALFKVS